MSSAKEDTILGWSATPLCPLTKKKSLAPYMSTLVLQAYSVGVLDLPFSVTADGPKAPTAVTCQSRGYDAYIQHRIHQKLGALWPWSGFGDGHMLNRLCKV